MSGPFRARVCRRPCRPPVPPRAAGPGGDRCWDVEPRWRPGSARVRRGRRDLVRQPDLLRGAVIEPIRGRRAHLQQRFLEYGSPRRTGRCAPAQQRVLFFRVVLYGSRSEFWIRSPSQWGGRDRGMGWLGVVGRAKPTVIGGQRLVQQRVVSQRGKCFAVGRDDTDGGFIDSWDGTSWTTALNEPGVSPSAVSCSTPASCVTVGGGPSNSLSSAVLVDGTWVAESVPDPGSDGFLYDVSCASPTFCMAVGSIQVNGAGWASGLTEAWDGASWLVVPSPNYPEDDLGPGFIGGGILISDSCVSAQACVAVGYGGGGVNGSSLSYPILAVVETWDGDAWSLTPTPAPVEPAGGGRADLRGVSCVPDANDAQCVAAGLQTPDNATISPLVETTSAAVGSLDATSTQVQSDGEGDLTATVTTGASPAFGALDMAAGGATPTGSVTFLNDGVPILSCPPLELDSGQASCSAGAGATGPITADYSGDATFDGSSSQQVGTLPVTYVGNGATGGTVPVDSASPTVPPPRSQCSPLAHSSGPDTTLLVGTQRPMAAVPPTHPGPPSQSFPARTSLLSGRPASALRRRSSRATPRHRSPLSPSVTRPQ